MKDSNLTLSGFNKNYIAYCEAMGLSKVFYAYADQNEDIMEGGIGFNENSGIVYIALENGITIISMMGNDVEYMTICNDEEIFFDSYEAAEDLNSFSKS